ncbi:MAG: restriction endonuclease subunit S [Bacteroidetes bacterium]|nr:restriction endonuclease subunit S [Bacteroidota bacterium]
MSSYIISKTLNPKRIFILQKSELEKRLDPFFYVPELLELEKKVLAKKPNKLRDYVQSLASGATPKTTESEKYYAEKENGIPFLRVQNLSPTGVLEFDDCKYINEETHNGMLKRSQVSAGDLLVKITGVGRMAVASVAPEEFEGNINQHVCVIKTGSKEISETLAAFLNSEIGEKLASRRSTGGTRPALDYPALLSIPIIEDKRILQITEKVIAQKQKNEAEAEKLLSSIDDYLLNELGIKLPAPPENTLQNRMFTRFLKEISNNRFDPFFHQNYFENIYLAISKSRYKTTPLKKVISSYSKGVEVGSSEYLQEGKPFVRVADITDFSINWLNADKKISENKFNELKKFYKPKIGEILYSKDGTIGFCVVVQEEDDYIISSGILRISCKNNFDNYLLKYILSSKVYKQLAERVSIGTVIKHLTIEDWLNLPIPVPPLDKQKEIAEHITGIRQQAQQLKDKTTELLKKASEEIEEILLN